ncbi:C-type isolectin Sp-CL4-like [Enoplosus armatus]|uniref:C-type isolectin Sp-CL4-like n=1 Tax=Enoplosus armatus TaxID=215367 RepID=UPI0039933A73
MRPVVITALLLLVFLVNVQSDITKGYLNVSSRNHGRYQGNLRRTCNKGYQTKPCNRKGWYRLDKNHCIRVFLTKKTFWEAEKTCQAHNGHQPSVHNAAEHDAVLCNAYKTWRGSNSHGRPMFWIGAHKHKGQFKWTDGTAFHFSRWNRHQPDNWFGQEGCVEINYIVWGAWNDEACWAKRPFMCVTRM